jgi:hypothetical protein
MEFRFNWIGFKFNWRETWCKLLSKVFKIAHGDSVEFFIKKTQIQKNTFYTFQTFINPFILQTYWRRQLGGMMGHYPLCHCILEACTFWHVLVCWHFTLLSMYLHALTPLILVLFMPSLSIEDSLLFLWVFYTWNKLNGYWDGWQCASPAMASVSMQWHKRNTFFSPLHHD